VQEKNIYVRRTFLFSDRIKCVHCLIPSMSFRATPGSSAYATSNYSPPGSYNFCSHQHY